MGKMAKKAQTAWVGIDVSAATVAVALEDDQGNGRELEEPNKAAGHRALRRVLASAGREVFVCIEATGIYHFDLALTLHATQRVHVMVANPRATKDFARAVMQRAKTDRVDARMLREFAKRMPFRPWTPPAPRVLAIRALARRIEALTVTRAQEVNRLHAAGVSAHLGPALRDASRAHIRFLDASIRTLSAQATALIMGEPVLARRFAQLMSVRGIGERSAVRLLAELAVLPADMTVRQWVAHCGLDPRPWDSGRSIHRPARISRTGNARLRAALYMPALVAIRCDAHARRFNAVLLARQKKPMQAIVAVMRKMLHAIYGMFANDETYDPAKCYRLAS
jgi:transposase